MVRMAKYYFSSIIHNNTRSLATPHTPGSFGIMRSFLFLLIHWLTTLSKLLGPGGIQSVLAGNLRLCPSSCANSFLV